MSEEQEPYDNGGPDVRVVDATSFTSIVATAIGMIDGAMHSDLPRSYAELERLAAWAEATAQVARFSMLSAPASALRAPADG